MKLVLYSGGQEKTNQVLHRALVSLVGERRTGASGPLKLTYVPFCSDNSGIYFRRAVRRYSGYGVDDFSCLPVDLPQSRREFRSNLKQALKSDIVYLAGGNTFYFLNNLRKSGALPWLRDYAESGGVLAGLSAGALILSPNIHLAGIPKFDADENEVGLKDLRAMGLTHFEFFPHYKNSERLNRALLAYSRKTENPIYACRDGGGIVVDGDSISALGPTQIFHRGVKIKLV